jgi:hypothetical protein
MPAAPESVAPTIRPYSVVAPLPPPGVSAAAEQPIGPSIPLPRPFPSKAQPIASAATAASAAAAPQARAPMPVNPLMTTGILDAPVEPGAIASEFAIDLGAAATVELARARWNELRASQSPLFDNLKPVIALKDGGRSGQELHLVAGPLTSSATSARLCAVLAGRLCPILIDEGPREEGGGEIGIKRNSLSAVINSAVVVPLDAMDIASVDEGLGVFGIEPDSLIEVFDRAVVLSLRPNGIAEVVESNGGVGIGPNCLIVVFDRAVVILHAVIDVASPNQGASEISWRHTARLDGGGAGAHLLFG